MSDEKNGFAKSFESLLGKSIEANKIFMTESSRMFRQFGSGQKKTNNFNVLSNDALSKAFNEYVKLNVEHFNNLVDLGINFMKSLNTGENDPGPQSDSDEEPPSFVLEKTVEAGQQVTLQFLLDNVKPAAVNCQLQHSAYSLQEDTSVQKEFNTKFSPQAFELKQHESKPVVIDILVPGDTAEGLYTSKVYVKGFEPAYFSIRLTVTAGPVNPAPDA